MLLHHVTVEKQGISQGHMWEPETGSYFFYQLI